ncbi:MAG: alkaline phosphatase PhoX [Chromatiaceae bacterium]
MTSKALLAVPMAIACGTFASAAAAQPDPQAPLKVSHVEFTATPAPVNADEMTTPYTTSNAEVTLADGSKKSFPLSYRVLHRSGEYVNGWYAGLIVDKNGKPVLRSPADTKGEAARGPFLAPGQDGTSLLMIPSAAVAGVKGNLLFLIDQLEYDTDGQNVDPHKGPVDLYGRLPMALNLTLLDQDPESGVLTPVRLANIDVAAVEGVWIPCNASTTPWMTHLGSEEYEPDAQVFENKPLEAMNLYRGTPGKTAVEGGANPYMYGHITEAAVKPDGSTSVAKHYSMGRLSFELGDVMGDGKTVYFGDDGDDVIRAMYVADQPNDLTAGTLYAAKWKQIDDQDYGSAKLEWIKLGHSTDAKVKALIDQGTRFSDIWEVATPNRVKADPAKYKDFGPVYVYAGTGGKSGLTYLRLKPGMEKAAAFLETRRYAAYRKATSELTKMEGQAHSLADKKLWTVISYARKGMVEGKNDDRPQDDIHLAGDAKDLNCGAVYESTLAGGQKDSDGNPIASDWVAVDMKGLIHGRRQAAAAKTGPFDKCDTERVANPDNIRFSNAMRTLFIGEDSGNHLNNFVWAYNVDTGKLVRIFSSPIGGENTGLNVFDDYNGHAYITANIQHPGAAGDLQKYPDAVKVEMRRAVDQRGWVGYIQGLPAMTR